MKVAVDQIVRVEHHIRLDATEVKNLCYVLRTFDQYHGRDTFVVGQFCRDLANLLDGKGEA